MRRIFALVVAVALSAASALQIEGVEYEDVGAYARTYGYSVAGGGQYILLAKDGQSVEFRSGDNGARMHEGRLFAPKDTLVKALGLAPTAQQPQRTTTPLPPAQFVMPAPGPTPKSIPEPQNEVRLLGKSEDGTYAFFEHTRRLGGNSGMRLSASEFVINQKLAGPTCIALVQAALKAPATAQFIEPISVRKHPNGWGVGGYVDAQNSYGALLRNSFFCEFAIVGNMVDITYDVY